jgi:hypothetical protein
MTSLRVRRFKTGAQAAVGVLAICFLALLVSAQGSTNVVTGTIEKVDNGTKTVAVKTADGTVETVKYTDRTTVTGLKDAGKAADLSGKEGSHIIVHTTGEGADKTAHSIEWVGDKTVHTADGTVEDVDKGSKTVAVKMADGTKETFHVADRATVDSGKDVARYSVRGAEKGEHVTVYYTEEAGKKVAHVFKKF